MTTKEDYEFAAKAAGIELEWRFPHDGLYYIKGTSKLWNPRFDGNDSQDLQVRVPMIVSTSEIERVSIGELYTPGDAQSMREAIFRVAVAVGRAM